jgi:hypothetical protein
VSIVHRMEGCGWKVQEICGGPDREVIERDLVVVHAQSDEVWIIPLPLHVADDMGAQLQGQPAKKHVEVPGSGALPPDLLNRVSARRNGN